MRYDEVMRSEIATIRADILAALLIVGPAPARIGQRTGLPLAVVQQTIIGDEDLRERYQTALGRVAAAIEAFGFDLQSAASYLGVRRSELNDYIRENAALGRLAEEQRLRVVDNAERNLAAAVTRGEWQATQFALERSSEGARRGYGQRSRIDVHAEAENLGVDPHVLRERLVRALIAADDVVESPVVAVDEKTVGDQGINAPGGVIPPASPAAGVEAI